MNMPMSLGVDSDASRSLATRARELLPQGGTLPHSVWLTRHRWLVTLLVILGLGVFAYALVEGYGFLHSAAEGGVLVGGAAVAWGLRGHQRIAGVVCSVGLISTAALLIHVSGGVVEAHFTFFVVIVLLSLYEDWLPFLFAAGYVLLHHGALGISDPAAIYNHPDALAHPAKWALIHTGFVLAAGAAGIVAWKLNENYRSQTEVALRHAQQSERSMAEAQELAQLGAFEYRLDREQIVWSDELYRVYGMDPSSGPPSSAEFSERIAPADRQPLGAALEQAIADRTTCSQQFRYRHTDGSERTIHMRAEVDYGPDGEPVRLVGTAQDVTDRERARRVAVRRADAQRAVAELGTRALEVADLEELFGEAVQTVTSALGAELAGLAEWRSTEEELVVVAAHGLPTAEGAHFSLTGWGPGGFPFSEPIKVDDWSSEARFARPRVLADAGALSSLTVAVQRRAAPFGVLTVASREAHSFDADDVTFLQAVANVLSAAIDRIDAEEDVRHRALHDPLTGLPNRDLFSDRLQHALEHAQREGHNVGVLFCDLDQFKLVNDTLGHEAGDELLRAVAPRLASALRAGDTVARFGGDEFGILVERANSVRAVTRAAERISAALAAPFVLRGREHFVTASVGIAIGVGAEAPETLIRDADLAMYRAKRRGRGRYELFDQLMRSRAVDHLRTENELRQALERDELIVHYQPMVSLTTYAITGFEALVRWRHPERGMISPAEFIPLAEESGLIVELGDRVLEIACAEAAAWHRADPDARPAGISVNISTRQLADPQFPDRVRQVLQRTGLQPLSLSLEVTETMLVDELEGAQEGCRRLKDLGVGLVLDDFGSGFSSLGYLRRFPFDLLKIDRSFVGRIELDPADATIIGSVAQIAEALGLGVVAEGIETREQLEAVQTLGCHQAQGYLFSKPLDAERAAELIGSRPFSEFRPAVRTAG